MGHVPQWLCEFDIDRYINPVIPASPLSKLPWSISRFLGYREHGRGHVCTPLTWVWSLIGGFCGIALIEGVYKSSSSIQELHPPVIIGSFGAAAILEYNAIESPLSQPRNLILGQVFSATIGVGITKLFTLLPHTRFQSLQWLSGALAVGSSSAFMSITNTVHPPAGATALLAATSPEVIALGWRLVPLVLLGGTLMLGSACLINNIQRKFPTYWWTPLDLKSRRTKDLVTNIERAPTPEILDLSQASVTRSSLRSADPCLRHRGEIKISAGGILVPDWLELDTWEKSILEILRTRLSESTVDVSTSGSSTEGDARCGSMEKPVEPV